MNINKTTSSILKSLCAPALLVLAPIAGATGSGFGNFPCGPCGSPTAPADFDSNSGTVNGDWDRFDYEIVPRGYLITQHPGRVVNGMYVDAGGELFVAATMFVKTDSTVTGILNVNRSTATYQVANFFTVKNGGTFQSIGTLSVPTFNVNNGGTVSNSGTVNATTLNNAGDYTNSGGTSGFSTMNLTGGTYTNSGGTTNASSIISRSCSITVTGGTMNAANVDSAGTFTVAGTGYLNLTGTNTFASFSKDGGTVAILDGSSSIAAAMANSGVLVVGDGTGNAGTAALAVQGGLTNSGTLAVQADGVLTVTGALEAQAGSTNTVVGGSLTADSLSLAGGASLILGGGAGQTGSATVSGAMTAVSESSWTVQGGNLTAGSLTSGATAAILDGRVAIQGALTNSGVLTVGDGIGASGTAILEAQGGLTNTGTLMMAGTDALVNVSGLFTSTAGSTLTVAAGRLSADSMSLAGMTTLSGGRLDVATPLTVTSTGRFDAAGGILVAPIVINHGLFNNISGTVSSANFANTGRLNLQAGSSAVFGHFAQSGAGTLVLDCNAASPLMTVAGDASLAGKVSFANTGALTFTQGNQVFVDIVGTKTGGFSNLHDGDVVRRNGVANYVYSSHLGDGNDIGLEIKYTDFHQIGQALVPALDSSLAMTRSVVDIQFDRLWNARQDGLLRNQAHMQALGGSASPTQEEPSYFELTRPADRATGLDDIDAGPLDAAYDAKENFAVYGLAKATRLDLDNGATSTVTSAALGGEWRPSDKFIGGALLGYSTSHYSLTTGSGLDAQPGSGDLTGETLGVYAAWQFLPTFWLDGQVAFSHLSLDTRREMIGGTLSGATSGSSLAYGGRVVWQAIDKTDPASGDSMRLAPFVGARFTDIRLDSFEEQGPQPTRISGLDALAWEVSAGVQWSQMFPQRTISYSTWGYHIRGELFTGGSAGGSITTTDQATSAVLSNNQWGGVGSGFRGTAGLDYKCGGWNLSTDLTRSQASEASSWAVQLQAGCSF